MIDPLKWAVAGACFAAALSHAHVHAATGPWRASEQNSYGWQFMTPQERVEHQRKLRSFSSYAECKTYQAQIHERMAERARAAGVELTPQEQSACEQLKARGALK